MRIVPQHARLPRSHEPRALRDALLELLLYGPTALAAAPHALPSDTVLQVLQSGPVHRRALALVLLRMGGGAEQVRGCRCRRHDDCRRCC